MSQYRGKIFARAFPADRHASEFYFVRVAPVIGKLPVTDTGVPETRPIARILFPDVSETV